MLTANRYDEIKTAVRGYQTDPQVALAEHTVQEVFDMLIDLAKDFDRMRSVVPVSGGRGHVKPVILDAQGQAVVPPPIAQQLAAERRAQYDADRFEAVGMPVNLDKWRTFCLRWGLAPPPGGWDSVEQITNVVHAIRLGIKQTSYVEKHFSAVYLTSRGIQLPHPAKLLNGVLSGVDLPDQETTGHGDGSGRFA